MKREPEGIACSFRMKGPSSMFDTYDEHEEVFLIVRCKISRSVVLCVAVLFSF
jgi:hypothetical protein